MKYILTLITSLFISHLSCQVMNQRHASGLSTNTSSNGYKDKWSANPIDEKIFIENKGQFDGLLPGHKKVLFSARLGNNTDAFFTTQGITYRYIELSEPNKNEAEQEEKERKDKELKSGRNMKTHYLSSSWIGTNPTVTVESVNKRSDVYIYPSSGASGIKADLFKKIIYRNLYKGVDAEYFFPQEGGIKYNLIVHPGADVSQIKIKYAGVKKLTENKSGDIIISSEIGNIVEHAPHSYYKNGEVVSSAFSLNDNVISFRLPDLDVNGQKPISNQTIIIDPWITNLFWYYGGANRGPWDLDCDDIGNVYCVADVGWVKLDNTGNVVWTIPRTAFPNYFSTDITVDRATGNVYVTLATGQLFKVSTNGNLLAKYISTPDFFHEMWRIGWDPCRNQLAIGAGGTGTSNTQAAWTDKNLSFMNYVNIEGATKNQHDIAALAIDPSGSDCYMAASNGQYDTLLNRLIKVPMPTLSPTTWLAWNKYNLAETQSNYYSGPFPWYNGMNILGVSPNWVYMWEGYVLRQFNKATGAINNTLLVQSPKRIPLPSANNPTREACRWSGLAVDLCDNIYAGYKTSINVYNASLTLVKTIPPISNTDTLNEIVLSSDYKTLYVCGSNFVRAIDLTNIPKAVNTTSLPASCSCNGTATTSLNFCGVPVTAGVTYLWDNGQTTATATGLCAGKHYVTLTYNCRPYSDTVIVAAPGGLTIATVQQTNILCHGGNTGSATINVSGGMTPYIYSWSAAGGTGKAASNLSAGNYTVTVTDANGCKITTIISITEPPSIIAKFTSVNNSCTTTGTASVLVNGGHNPYTYNWSNGSSGPDAYSLAAGNYTVTVIDNIGCTETKTFTITGTNPVSANFTYSPNSPVCYNSTVYFTNTGTPAGAGITHTWTSNPSLVTGSTADFSYTFLTYGTFSVTHTVSNGTCSSSVTKNISIINCNIPNATIAPATICNGACVTLTPTVSGGTGPFYYRWSTGATSQTINACPATTSTYTVAVNDGYGFGSTTTVEVKVNTCSGSPTITSSANSICPGSCATVTSITSGGTSPFTYSWSTGATTQNINPCPASTTTYTVKVTDNGGATATTTVSIIVYPSIAANTTAGVINCSGASTGSATATGSGGTSPYTFAWSNGQTSQTATSLAAGNYTVTVVDTKGCASTSTATIISPAPLSGQFTKGTANCANCGCKEWIMVNVTGGTGPYNYSWPDGYVNRYKNQLCPGNYSVNIKDKNGCSMNVNLTAP